MRLLVLGGTRSGKSAHAESVAVATGGNVVYVATARSDHDDAEMTARIAVHKDRRPAEWSTEETDEITRVLADHPDDTVLVDDLGGWLTRRMDATLGWSDGGAAVAGEVDSLVSAVTAHTGSLILVSPEVGLGVVPDSLSGRLFSDLLGGLNRRLADVCDSAVLVVAGRVLTLSDTAVPAAQRAIEPPPAPETRPGVEKVVAVAVAPGPEDFPGLGDVEYYDDPVTFPPVHPPSYTVADEARARQLELTKPSGSLGRLEEIGVWISACQETCPPRPLDRARVVVFAGDHGVATNGVSAFPQEVTLQMADNIVGGGAAVSVLARAARATVRVADMSMAAERPGGLDDHKIRRSSGSIDREDALSHDEVRAAVAAGRRIADEEVDSGADLLIAGDLGIGNTTPATVITCLVTGREPVELVGRGTGIDDGGWMRKTAAIRDAMFRASGDLRDPVGMLRRVAGADLAAMAGFLAQAAVRKTPCILDGSVVTAAALLAEALAPGARQWWVA
ncbi:nicotinate-nucleotide--dimethylbenzimidazole phosphoribosyltransferase, partial [Dietzia sp. DQ11-38-2]